MTQSKVLQRFISTVFRSPKYIVLTTVALAFSTSAVAADLTIHLAGVAVISRKTIEYRCDGGASNMGVPARPFRVEYINGGGNSLAVIPITGNMLIFSNVFAGSGARYTAGTFTWWEAGGQATLSSDSLAGKTQAVCHRTKS